MIPSLNLSSEATNRSPSPIPEADIPPVHHQEDSHSNVGLDVEAGVRPRMSLSRRISIRLLNEQERSDPEVRLANVDNDLRTPDNRVDITITANHLTLLFQSAVNSRHKKGMHSKHSKNSLDSMHSKSDSSSKESLKDSDEILDELKAKELEKHEKKAPHHREIRWEQEVEEAVNKAVVMDISDSDREIIKNYCNKVQKRPWFGIGSVIPGQLKNVQSDNASKDLKELDPDTLEFMFLTNDNIRNLILKNDSNLLTEDSIVSMLNLICKSVQKCDYHEARNRIVTATTLVEKYGREQEKGKSFDDTILKFTEVALQQLPDHEREAGVVMGVLLAAMHRNADRSHKIVVNSVAATSVAVTCLWAWSYLGKPAAVAAAVAVTAFSLFEYFNLAPKRHFDVDEMELAVIHAVLNTNNGIDSGFQVGFDFSKKANRIK